ncbi:MAG: D-glycero-beta-D-manno-heptose 1-phosphate adenylyltransferase [Candidatus Binatota bacterium]|nr:D-glycero-beta-D-manno-heptose 1-phosphate adenylyltransferase [Candidatus Binatota bacterium]
MKGAPAPRPPPTAPNALAEELAGAECSSPARSAPWRTRRRSRYSLAVRRVLSREELANAIAADRRAGRRIVFTNGCFDLLHPGHVRSLRDARALGDVLVVAVNGDASVARLDKGAGRPLVGERDRAEVLAALDAVDYVTIFDEDTPLEVIRALEPDVLVKGGDWTPDAVVGADVVRRRGGRVELVPRHPEFSTTELVRRIRAGEAAPGLERPGETVRKAGSSSEGTNGENL